MKILYIDSCLRDKAISRTSHAAEKFLEHYMKNHPEDEIERVELGKQLPGSYDGELVELRDQKIKEECWDDPMFSYALQFSQADKVIIAAPYWDLSFPAALKLYIENIMVTNLTFGYTETGSKPLCKGEKLLYITSAGGLIEDQDFGGDYIKGVAAMIGHFKVEEVKLEGLDILGANVDAIMEKAYVKLEELAQSW